MAYINVEIESLPYFDEDGIKISTFIGEEDDPVEEFFSWRKIIDAELDSYLIRDVAFAKDSEFYEIDQFRAFANHLREAADYFDQRINNSYLFDREAWDAAGAEPEQFMDFCTKISELDDSKNQLNLPL